MTSGCWGAGGGRNKTNGLIWAGRESKHRGLELALGVAATEQLSVVFIRKSVRKIGGFFMPETVKWLQTPEIFYRN